MKTTLPFASKMLGLGALLALSAVAAAGEYRTRVIATGLQSPTGLTVGGSGIFTTVFFTQNPTPGVSGANGGRNSVNALFLGTNITLHTGEPDPQHITLANDGSLYWTCRTAGVILEREPNGTTTPFATGLKKPNGIAAGADGTIYFTQLPTPGVNGANGGMNTVSAIRNGSIFDLALGEPEPTDIAVDPRTGNIYWTCKSAGVILTRHSQTGIISLFLGGLNKPSGIDIDRRGNLFFTEVPTPGISGANGGGNFVWEVDLGTKSREIVDFGDPQPTDVAVDSRGNVYWTCTSAGVIVRASK